MVPSTALERSSARQGRPLKEPPLRMREGRLNPEKLLSELYDGAHTRARTLPPGQAAAWVSMCWGCMLRRQPSRLAAWLMWFCNPDVGAAADLQIWELPDLGAATPGHLGGKGAGVRRSPALRADTTPCHVQGHGAARA